MKKTLKHPYFITSIILLIISIMMAALLFYMEAYDFQHVNIFGPFYMSVPFVYAIGCGLYFKSMSIKWSKAGFIMMYFPIFYVGLWFLSFMVRAQG